jgi:hypothetical protein
MEPDEARALRDELEALQQVLAHGPGDGPTEAERAVAQLEEAVAQAEDQLVLARGHLVARGPAVAKATLQEQGRSVPGLTLLLVFAGAVLLAGSTSSWSTAAVFAVGVSGAVGLGALAGWRR